MTERWTLDQFREHHGLPPLPGAGKKKPAPKPAPAPAQVTPPKKSKMRNNRTRIDGILFDSQLEAAYYLYLCSQQKIGEVSYFHRQVPINCGAEVIYRVDFQVFWTKGAIDYVDVKGRLTNTYKNKKKQIEFMYPFKIIEIYKADIPEFYRKAAAEHYQLSQITA